MSVWRSVIVTVLLTLIVSGISACPAKWHNYDLPLNYNHKPGTDYPPVITERPEMDHTWATQNFKIHYNTTGDSAVYHPEEDINPVDGVPDYVNRVGGYFEAAHQVYIYELGYDKPPPDDVIADDNKYDVYITTTTGQTIPERLSNHYQDGREAWTSYINVGNNMVTEHNPDDPYPYLASVCAHEYFHAVQMAYRAFPNDEKEWFYELTAMWAEERVFDNLNELYHTLEYYYGDIEKSIYLFGGLHMYGAWTWAEYLSQNYGNDIIRSVFENLKYNPNSMSSLYNALSAQSLDLNTEFTIYSVWNYFTGPNYRHGFFEEAQNFPTTVPIISSHFEYPVGWQFQIEAIENLGISYIYFENPGINKGDLIITTESDSRFREGVCVGSIFQDGRPVELQHFKLSEGESVDIRVEDFDECLGAIMAVNWNHQDSTIYGKANYRYRAYIDSVTVDIKTGSEDIVPSAFTLNGNYPNPFNLSTEITFYWNFDPSYYTIAIYDITGRQVDAISGSTIAGENRVNWRANDNLVSGIYFYRINVGDQSDTGRMTLIK